MSLYRRKGVWHYDFTVGGHRHRGTTRLRSKTDAAKIEEQAKRAVLLGETSRTVLTIGEVADKWFAAKHADRKSATTTALRVRIMLRHIGADTLVSDIDAPEIADAIAKRRMEPTRQSTQGKKRRPEKTPSASTINRDMIDTTLRPMLRYAKRTLKQPVHDIDWKELRGEEPKERVRSFTPAEFGAWEDRLPVWHRPLRNFMGRYGVRLREAFFPLAAINTQTWEITIRGPRRKNGRPHIIPLLPEDARMIAALMGRAEAAGLDTVWFRELKSGELRAIAPRGYQSAAKAALVKANISEARPSHDLRHHAGTAAMRAGGNLKVVQELLGHENIQSTARYAHADRSDVLRVLRHVTATSASITEESMIENKELGADRTGT